MSEINGDCGSYSSCLREYSDSQQTQPKEIPPFRSIQSQDPAKDFFISLLSGLAQEADLGVTRDFGSKAEVLLNGQKDHKVNISENVPGRKLNPESPRDLYTDNTEKTKAEAFLSQTQRLGTKASLWTLDFLDRLDGKKDKSIDIGSAWVNVEYNTSKWRVEFAAELKDHYTAALKKYAHDDASLYLDLQQKLMPEKNAEFKKAHDQVKKKQDEERRKNNPDILAHGGREVIY